MVKTKGPLADRNLLVCCWFNMSVEHAPNAETLYACIESKERRDLCYLVLFLSDRIVFFNASGPLF